MFRYTLRILAFSALHLRIEWHHFGLCLEDDAMVLD